MDVVSSTLGYVLSYSAAPLIAAAATVYFTSIYTVNMEVWRDKKRFMDNLLIKHNNILISLIKLMDLQLDEDLEGYRVENNKYHRILWKLDELQNKSEIIEPYMTIQYRETINSTAIQKKVMNIAPEISSTVRKIFR